MTPVHITEARGEKRTLFFPFAFIVNLILWYVAVELIYSVVFGVGVQQTDSVTHVIYQLFFGFLFHTGYCRTLSRGPGVVQ